MIWSLVGSSSATLASLLARDEPNRDGSAHADSSASRCAGALLVDDVVRGRRERLDLRRGEQRRVPLVEEFEARELGVGCVGESLVARSEEHTSELQYLMRIS